KLAAEALRQTEQRLRTGEEHYRTLFEDSPFPMWEEDFSAVKAYIDSLGAADLRSYLADHPEAVKECVRRVKVLDINRAARNSYGAASKEEQFVQSQKMESLGRLAGGVAHDFNNLLTVINGYSDLILRGIDDRHPWREAVSQIKAAGARGAELTQQLLAFGRKQVSQPHAF